MYLCPPSSAGAGKFSVQIYCSIKRLLVIDSGKKPIMRKIWKQCFLFVFVARLVQIKIKKNAEGRGVAIYQRLKTWGEWHTVSWRWWTGKVSWDCCSRITIKKKENSNKHYGMKINRCNCTIYNCVQKILYSILLCLLTFLSRDTCFGWKFISLWHML